MQSNPPQFKITMFIKTDCNKGCFGYPPFDLIQLIISAEDEDLTKDSSEKLKKFLEACRSKT